MYYSPRLPQHLPEVHLVTLSEQAQKLIAKQRRKYIESMPDKREAICQYMAQVSNAMRSGKGDLCDTLFQQVHRLAGSAGSYGFESLGEAASVVDRYLIANSPKVTDSPELESLLQNLLNEIDDIIQKSG